MKTTTGSNYSQPPTSQSPSVPLCVYRELTADLQAVQAKLDVVTNHNQKLSQENQQLRQEITKVIQSCLELQKLVDSSAPSTNSPHRNNNEVSSPTQPQPIPRDKDVKYANKPLVNGTSPRREANRPPQEKVKKAAPPQKLRQESAVHIMDMNFPVSETVFIEEQEVRYSPYPQTETKGLNGWWLVITIVLIMITGFGAGYLIVRPLLQNQTHIPDANDYTATKLSCLNQDA
ncbi:MULTISPECIES: hypothetical protein [unclassified Anabaena]|uniref:hypothetical protein n=1 Tax=unclassified Anabaena TaxID=2619674 RepID=UPI001447209D|nr:MULTISPECIES: hypothetical protein [unclassified Anabaena]MTJ09388.1 hypothetical protein [Anabaena sp. UHCC 0204]MTJ55533.1 hypothetical protein [Anabaena sp. UHCC 0253]